MQATTIRPLAAAFAAAGIPCVQGEPLALHTTFHIGGPAALFCRPRSRAQLTRALALCRQYGARHYLLGNGSNTLFADAGFDGVVLCTAAMRGRTVSTPQADGTVRMTVGAGQGLGAVCTLAQKQGLSGLEFAYGIPGTVGGAVYMNAGAYGGKMEDVLHSVAFLDEEGAPHVRRAAALALGYRASIFQQRPWTIVGATFTLRPDDPARILADMQRNMRSRQEKQPLELPSAGSTFKRPAGAFAGKLIEDCGLRGYTVGGAAVSQKHCGFVVNLGGATCADVMALTDHVRAVVRERTGYELEREIRVVE